MYGKRGVFDLKSEIFFSQRSARILRPRKKMMLPSLTFDSRKMEMTHEI